MLFLILAHIKTVHRYAEYIGEAAGKLRLADAGGADKKETGNWFVFRPETGA
jgi:hypothetical protein